MGETLVAERFFMDTVNIELARKLFDKLRFLISWKMRKDFPKPLNDLICRVNKQKI